MFVDTHAHLVAEAFDDDRLEAMRRAEEAGVTTLICVGDTVEASKAAAELSAASKSVWATAGVHPHNAHEAPDGYLEELEKLLDHPKVVAVGEVGLDYHYDFSPRDVQQRVFREQVQLAIKRKLPLVIHSRESLEDVLRILKEEGAEAAGGVLHCFMGSVAEAEQAMGMGFYLGVGGPITFKNADSVREVVAQLPLDRLVVETDAPYLAPVPYRGKRNEPAYILETARALAALKQVTFEEVANVTASNARKLFGIA